jgi:hypothetical protein
MPTVTSSFLTRPQTDWAKWDRIVAALSDDDEPAPPAAPPAPLRPPTPQPVGVGLPLAGAPAAPHGAPSAPLAEPAAQRTAACRPAPLGRATHAAMR